MRAESRSNQTVSGRTEMSWGSGPSIRVCCTELGLECGFKGRLLVSVSDRQNSSRLAAFDWIQLEVIQPLHPRSIPIPDN